MSRKEIRIAGFGGQGVVLSGTIIGKAAAVHGSQYATLIQNYGPESRGGSCRAEVVIGDQPIDYPYVMNPDVLILLSQEAYNDFAANASPDTVIIVDADLVKINSAVKRKPLSVPCSRMAKEMGRPVVANIIMLGFLAGVSDLVPGEAMRKAIIESVPAGTEEFNMKAFALGYNYGIGNGTKKESRRA